MRFWFFVLIGMGVGIAPAAAARVSDIQAGQNAFQTGKYADAITRFSNIIAKGKADKKVLARVFLLRGIAYRRLKRPTSAIADFSNAIWLDELPVSLQSRAYINRGQLRLLMSQHDQALKDMNEAVRLAPSAMSYSARAEALVRLGDSARAIADLDRALRDKAALRYRIHFIRAQAFEALGRKADARANLQKALGYKPGFKPASRMLAALGGAVVTARTAANHKPGGRSAPQRADRIVTGSIRPHSAAGKSSGDAAEKDWTLATRTIRGTAAPEPVRRSGPAKAAGMRLRRAQGSREFVLQLSARRTLETAKVALHHIASANRDLLSGRELYVEKAHSARLGEIYRVRLGYFTARGEPAKLCGRLKIRGQPCFLARR